MTFSYTSFLSRRGCLACLLAACVAGLPLTVPAQTLEETLNELSADAAASYLKPISSAMGADLNGGWFHRAPEAKKLGLDLEFGFVAMGSFFPSDATNFSINGSFTFSEDEARDLIEATDPDLEMNAPLVFDELLDQLTSQSSSVGISGATVIGSEDDLITIAFGGGSYDVGLPDSVELDPTTIVLPIGGYGNLSGANLLPLMTPQFSLGTVFGTQLTIRFLPSVELSSDLGSFNYFGFGLQHNPAAWMEIDLPVDLAASFFSQNIKVGDMFTTKTTAFGVNASKKFGAGLANITPYAGLMFESAKMEVNYDYIIDTPTGPMTQPINFEITGENKSRITLGLSVKLLMLNINADYNIGKYNSFTAGLNIRI